MDIRDEIPRAEIEKLLALALGLYREVRVLMRDYFARGVEAKTKGDRTLVTEVDLETERRLRAGIGAACPEHGVFGEELAETAAAAEWQWIIDPLDGTQSFVHGVPTFGSMLALNFRGLPVLGVIDHPALDLCYYAAYGLGAFSNQTRIRIADAGGSALDWNEIICLSNRAAFSACGEDHIFDLLTRTITHFRVYYDCFGLTRALHGQAGAALEFNVPLWDIAPCRIMIEEAGGAYADMGQKSTPRGKLYSAIFGKPEVVRYLTELVNTAGNAAQLAD